MNLSVKIPNSLSNIGDVFSSDIVIPEGTPVRFNFIGEPIGHIKHGNEPGVYILNIDCEKLNKQLNLQNIKRLFPAGRIGADGNFELTECSITPFSFSE